MFALVIVIINAIVYAIVFLIWLKDCKKYGKDNLALKLDDRMKAIFFLFTIPCILGLASRKER